MADTTQASKDRLCQDIADRVEMTRAGKGGKTSLRTPQPGGECESEEGRTKGSREDEEAARESGLPTSRDRSQGSTGLVRSLGGGLGGENALDTGKVRYGAPEGRLLAAMSCHLTTSFFPRYACTTTKRTGYCSSLSVTRSCLQ